MVESTTCSMREDSPSKDEKDATCTHKQDQAFVKLPPICRCSKQYAGFRRSRRKWCDLAVSVRILWAGLSVIVTGICCFTFVQPHWLASQRKTASFGMYNYCVQDSSLALDNDLKGEGQTGNRSSLEVKSRVIVERDVQYVVIFKQTCGPYGRYFRLAHLPSNAWQIACVLFGGGCFLLGFGAIAALVTSVLVDWWASRLAGYTGYIQTMGVITCAGGLLTFPLGLDSSFVGHYCPGSRMYYSGGCHMGWAYLLAVMATAISVFCPFLSQYVTFNDNEGKDIYL